MGVVAGMDDAWKNTATTAATYDADCCAAKATCGASPTCAAGWKAKTSNDATKCIGLAGTCANSAECCELDVLKCGGLPASVCGADRVVSGTDDAWKSTDTTANTYD